MQHGFRNIFEGDIFEREKLKILLQKLVKLIHCFYIEIERINHITPIKANKIRNET